MKPDITMTIIDVPCPDCGELSPEPIERIVHNDIIPCSLCAGLIDLSADEANRSSATRKAFGNRRLARAPCSTALIGRRVNNQPIESVGHLDLA